MASDRRFVLVLAGTQAGKTFLGPHWLYREIRRCGPGDYLVVAPTYPLMQLKALPEFLRFFKQTLNVGDFIGSPVRRFTFSREGSARTFGDQADNVDTCVYFGHAGDPDSLESATAKAAWLDEAGQEGFKLGSWEALQRRLSIHQGRALITTTPYNLGWLKQQVYDRWRSHDADYDVISFTSLENPAFPRAEYERAERTLPRWKFDLFYRAQFTRPAGMIYDCYDESVHVVPRFALDPRWPRFVGLDFGGVNTAAVFLAREPVSGRLYAYREYKAGGRTAAEHAAVLHAGEVMLPLGVGGAKSEDQWRDEFSAAGLPVQAPPVWEVEVGIDRVYGAFRGGDLFLFSDLAGLRDELGSYSRELDSNGEPTEKIAAKETYHRLDALRYIVSYLLPRPAPWEPSVNPANRTLFSQAPQGVWGDEMESPFR